MRKKARPLLSPMQEAALHIIAKHGGEIENLARLLGVAQGTAKTHKSTMTKKLGAHGLGSPTSAAVATAFRKGLLNGVVSSLARPTDEYRADRIAHPYVVRYDDGTSREMHTWGRKLPEEMSTE